MKKRTKKKPATSDLFPIVGVGASAGGLEAFSQLLDAIPANTGMAFVLIQHLDPAHESLLAEALTRATKMPVTQAVDGGTVLPNHVYVIPPNADLAIHDGVLTLAPRTHEPRRPHLAIDVLLRSLAEEHGSRAIGVILSGGGTDGTEGLKAIKGEDGITFAQDPATAKFDGMPRSAIEANVIDFVLPIPDIAKELVRLSRHPYVSSDEPAPPSDEATLIKILGIVRNAVGVDFSEYKVPTFERRLARRMALRHQGSLGDYLALLRTEPDEVGALYEDILIHVTSFFRDPEVFESLSADVFPTIVNHKSPGEPIRLWSAGCATGEEVYSIAMTLLELLEELGGPSHPIQIFGSDVSDSAIERARLGVYSEGRMKDVSEERRRRFFTRLENGFRINKSVRDMCVFVRHDLAKDPPFSKLDLVSCRNVLIYFSGRLQKRVLPTFHYALNPGGFLLVGRTESLSGSARIFVPRGNSKTVFMRAAGTSTLRFAPRTETHAAQPLMRFANEIPKRRPDLGKQLDRMLLSHYSPPGVLINERMDILQFSGETGEYLRPGPGEPQNNVAKMARAGLLVVLRSALERVKKLGEPVRIPSLEVGQGRSGLERDVIVMPFAGIADSTEPLFVVLFEEPAPARPAKGAKREKTRAPVLTVTAKRVVRELETKLAATEKYLQSLIDDQDRTNEDLNAANEELTSGNEELQSMNEELETAKEELQSTNEELVTVNDELHSRNLEAAETNSDLVNLLSTVDVPILILDAKRRIRRFNPKARSILSILPSDVGRPLDDIKSNLAVSDLDERIAKVIETNEIHESEVQGKDGCWYRMQIRPYRTTENRIEGATLSLVDIDALKHHVNEAQAAKSEAERANRAKDEFLATLSHEIRTPLSSMLMQAQLLRRGELDSSKVKRAGEAIERGTRMQVKLIDDLLDVSRIVAGKLSIEFKPVDVRVVIEAALESVHGAALAKSVTFDVSLDPSIGVVDGDDSRLQQVVCNLLTNAIKFSPEKGVVSVALESSKGLAHIIVRDHGSGIDPSFLPHVFSRFAQEDGSTIRKHGGLGLGLAIARHLVEAHGGHIRAESPGKGMGATFSITLPLLTGGSKASGDVADEAEKEPSASGGTAASERSARSPLKAVRVLVVDDDLATRDALADLLHEMGASVAVAASAEEGLAAVETFRPAVLLCDIAMPSEDGYSLIRKIRRLPPERGGDLPAVALTAFGGEENRLRAISAGFHRHMVKPADIDHLTVVIAALARGKSPTA